MLACSCVSCDVELVMHGSICLHDHPRSRRVWLKVDISISICNWVVDKGGAVIAGCLNYVSNNRAVYRAVLAKQRLVEVRELVLATALVVPGMECLIVGERDGLMATHLKGHLPACSYQSFRLSLKIHCL